MTIQRVFALTLCIISLTGFSGSLSLQMFRGGNNIGPGFMPLVYSIVLFIFSALLFFTDRSQEKMSWRGLFNQYAKPGWIYYLLNFVMFILIYIIGMLPAMAFFGISSQVILKRQNLLWASLFTVLWVGAIYIVFVVLLKIPFEKGLLFN